MSSAKYDPLTERLRKGETHGHGPPAGVGAVFLSSLEDRLPLLRTFRISGNDELRMPSSSLLSSVTG